MYLHEIRFISGYDIWTNPLVKTSIKQIRMKQESVVCDHFLYSQCIRNNHILRKQSIGVNKKNDILTNFYHQDTSSIHNKYYGNYVLYIHFTKMVYLVMQMRHNVMLTFGEFMRNVVADTNSQIIISIFSGGFLSPCLKSENTDWNLFSAWWNAVLACSFSSKSARGYTLNMPMHPLPFTLWEFSQ